MAEDLKQKKKKTRSPLVGTKIKPTTLDSTTKIDIDVTKALIDDIIEASIGGKLDSTSIDRFTTLSTAREQLYQAIDNMGADSSVAAIIRTLATDVCETADNGHIMWCESTDPNISKFVNYLLNVINVDKVIFGWAWNLIKYGDVYVRLFRESDYNDVLFKKDHVNKATAAQNSNILNENLQENINLKISSINDHYSYYVEMAPDPGTMFELVKFGKTMGYIETPNEVLQNTYLSTNYSDPSLSGGIFNYKVKSSDINIYQADDFVHAFLDNNYSRQPEKVSIFLNDIEFNAGTGGTEYSVRRGKSLLQDNYKVWRERALIESAVLLNRNTKSSVVRTIQVEVGDMGKDNVKKTLSNVKSLFEQKAAINTNSSMSEYTNPSPVENNVYIATRNGKGAVTVGSVGGDVDIKGLADLDQWNNKFYGAFNIPKQYFGYTDDGAGFNGGTALSIISSEYAKSVKQVQGALIQMVTDMINLFLIEKGCKSFLNNFVLKMKAPLTQEEIDYRSSLTNRISAISNLLGLFTDVEDRGKKLKILKALVSTLNYGDEIIAIIQEEIDAAELEALKQKEQQEAEAKAAAEEAERANATTPDADSTADDNLDLPSMESTFGEAIQGQESSTTPEKERLVEETTDLDYLDIGDDLLVENDENLPSPEDLSADIDFTQNN